MINKKITRLPGGVHTALVTPFDKTGNDIDKEGFMRLIKLQLEAQVPGIVVLGTTGEAPTVNGKERELLIDTAAQALSVKSTVLTVGCGSYDTAQTVAQVKRAAALGANAALVVTPYYNKPDKRGLMRHFLTVAEASEIPVILYNVPSRTGTDLDIQTLCVLSHHDNIIALKEASTDMSSVIDKLSALDGFDVFCGNDSLIYPFLCLGAKGIISVASNISPDKTQDICCTIESGDFISAKDKYYALLPFYKALASETNPIPIKALLGVAGIINPGVRSPLYGMKEEARAELIYAAIDAGIRI